MKIFLLIILVFLISFSTNTQNKKIEGTFEWDLTEFLTISKDSFKLYLYTTEPFIYGLERKDTVLSEGKVQYESDNFIKLTSKDYELDAKRNMTIIESRDSSSNDNLRFNFIFPYDGKYKIILYIGNDYKKENKFELKNSKEIVLPMFKDSVLSFSFIILNQTPIEFSYRNYLKNVQFSSFQNIAKKIYSNSFEISIPNLTNSYFNRFLINGEYIRVNKEKNVLFWQNKQYLRLGKSSDR